MRMNPCDGFIATLRYLDNDLKGQELERFCSHLQSCAVCRGHLEAERELSERLHRSGPLYSAPVELRDRVSAAIQEASSSRRLSSLYECARSLLAHLNGALERLSNWRVLVPATLAILLSLALVPNMVRNVQATSYVDVAVATHRKFLGGRLAPGLQSNSQPAVTAWFKGKVPFDFRLPAAESISGAKPAYQLTGATLVTYKGTLAALVTYEAPQDKISLLVASSQSAVVAGGDEVGFGKLKFHYRAESGFRVITWSNHDLSYALVSSVSGPARASCLVCHQNMSDRSKFNMHP
jgi:anti-sigma factor RsiW